MRLNARGPSTSQPLHRPGVDGVRSRQDHDAISSTFGAPGRRLGRVTVEAMSTGEPRHVAVPGIAPREPFVGNRGVRALAVATDPHGKVQYGKVQYGQDSRPGDHAVAVLPDGVPDTYVAASRGDGGPACAPALTVATSPLPWMRTARRSVRRSASRSSCRRAAWSGSATGWRKRRPDPHGRRSPRSGGRLAARNGV